MSDKKFILSEINVEDSLKKAFSMKPNEIALEIRNSGVRGRGGAGFSTGTKWMLCGAATDDKKYVICNADEGEPGTFKDRELLVNYFEKLIAGMVIAGYSIKSDEGIIYLRGEYKWMLPQINAKLDEMTRKGWLGDNILNSGFNFHVEIVLGAGAYVCGEETALIESIEGRRGEPRNKPPYPVNQGLHNKPTLVNNVETFCVVPHILEKGAKWFKSLGTEQSSGMKLFSISGDVEKPGVYEFEMGTPLSVMLKAAGAKNPKAVQVGGASGRTVNEKEFDQPVAFEALPPGGSIIVIGKERSMLDVLENFMEFFEEESCGQCTYCREGNYQLLKGVKKLRRNQLTKKELKNLKDLAELMKVGSKCGLGQTSPNPFLDIIENFEDEVLQGIQG